jgi:hypothetical protein
MLIHRALVRALVHVRGVDEDRPFSALSLSKTVFQTNNMVLVHGADDPAAREAGGADAEESDAPNSTHAKSINTIEGICILMSLCAGWNGAFGGAAGLLFAAGFTHVVRPSFGRGIAAEGLKAAGTEISKMKPSAVTVSMFGGSNTQEQKNAKKEWRNETGSISQVFR